MSTPRDIAVIAAVSPKGGVGKTTLVANLSAALAGRGRPLLMIDLDPQNALRLHHQMPLADSGGLAVQALRGEPWENAVFRGAFGVDCLAYGNLAEPDRRRFEQVVDADPNWFSRGIASLQLAPRSIVLVDTPPGGTVYLRQALGAATAVLAVMLPDAASFVTLPSMERWLDDYCRSRSDFRGGWYMVNRMNSSRVLCRDVLSALSQQLGDRLSPQVVHFDASLEEALASQAPVSRYAPESIAARDIAALAEWMVTVI